VLCRGLPAVRRQTPLTNPLTLNPSRVTCNFPIKKGFPRFCEGTPMRNRILYRYSDNTSFRVDFISNRCALSATRGYWTHRYLFSCCGGSVPIVFQSAKSDSLPDICTGIRCATCHRSFGVSRHTCCPVSSLVWQAPHRLCGHNARSVFFRAPMAIIKTSV
jgi:hypothetical protein